MVDLPDGITPTIPKYCHGPSCYVNQWELIKINDNSYICPNCDRVWGRPVTDEELEAFRKAKGGDESAKGKSAS